MKPNAHQIALSAAIELIKEMGTIIRYLDENRAYAQYWIKDDSEQNSGHVPKALELNIPQ